MKFFLISAKIKGIGKMRGRAEGEIELLQYYERAVEYLTELSGRLLSIISTIEIRDIIDMIVMAFIIYKGIKIIRETKAQQLITGIFIMLVVYLISTLLKLKMMTFLFGNFFQVGLIAIIVVFQPELRRVLERVGRTNVKVFNSSSDEDIAQRWEQTINIVAEAASMLSDSTTGALIVFERQVHLGDQIATGTIMDCIPSVAAFGTIFFPKTALHDGAVILRDGLIHAAGCFLPTPMKEETINKQLGSRHRAAIGMSETSDAIIIVVSEETGTISVAENGELTRGYSKEKLIEYLRAKIIHDNSREVNITGILKYGKELINGRKKGKSKED